MFLNGYHATGIKEITDSINIPKGSFYNHFSSKEEFGCAVLQYYCNYIHILYKEALLNPDLTPLKRFDVFFSNIIDNFENVVLCKLGCIMGNFSLELGDTHESFRKILDEEFNKIESIFVQCLDDAKAAGEINSSLNTKDMGGFILNSWHGAILRMKSTATIRPLTNFKNILLNQILNNNNNKNGE